MLKVKVLLVTAFVMLSSIIVSAEPSACPKTQPLTFWIGATGHVADNSSSRVRSIPSIDGEILKELPSGTSFTVVGDFVCADDYRWWQIKADDMTGWVAEGPKEGGYYIEKDEIEPPVIDNSALIDIWAAGSTHGGVWTTDRRTLAMASEKGIWIYSGDDPEAAPRLLLERNLSVRDVAFDPRDSNMLYAVNEDNSLSRWNVVAGSVEPFGHFGAWIKNIFFSEMGHALAVILEGGEIDIFIGEGYATPLKFTPQQAQSRAYTSVTFSHDESMMALASKTGHIDLFDLNGQRLMTFALGGHSIDALAFNLDDTVFAASGEFEPNSYGFGNGMRLWDMRSQAVVGEFAYGVDDLSTIRDIVFLPDGRILTGEEQFMAFWRSIRDPQTLEVIEELSVDTPLNDLLGKEDEPLYATFNHLADRPDFALTPDESRMVLNSESEVEVIDTKTGRVVMSLPQGMWSSSMNYTISTDGRYFAGCFGGDGLSWEPTIVVFDISGNGPTMPSVNGHDMERFPTACDLVRFISTPDGERLVFDKYISPGLMVWDFIEDVMTEKPLPSPSPILSRDDVMYGNTFVVAVSDSTDSPSHSLAIYDLSESDTASRIITPDWVSDGRNVYRTQKMALASETMLAVTAGLGGRDVIVYDLTTLSETARIQTPSEVTTLAAVGSWVATVHSDGIIRLWNINHPETPTILGQVPDVPAKLVFSADFQRLYGGGYTWDVSSIIGE